MSQNTKIVIGVIAILFVCMSSIGLFLLIGGGLFLSPSISASSGQYFLTVNEIMTQQETIVDKQIRISGAVIGDTIEFDEVSRHLTFLIADVPADYAEVEAQGGLAVVLENAVNDSSRQRIQIAYTGEKPELLRNMAQAIVLGKLQADGIFYADEILLKCPARYEEAVPDQAVN